MPKAENPKFRPQLLINQMANQHAFTVVEAGLAGGFIELIERIFYSAGRDQLFVYGVNLLIFRQTDLAKGTIFHIGYTVFVNNVFKAQIDAFAL